MENALTLRRTQKSYLS